MSLENNEPTPNETPAISEEFKAIGDFLDFYGLKSIEEVAAFIETLGETANTYPIDLVELKDLEGINFPEIPTEGEQG